MPKDSKLSHHQYSIEFLCLKVSSISEELNHHMMFAKEFENFRKKIQLRNMVAINSCSFGSKIFF
jgi:hypothetical protein